jgi:tripeptidyl-peptidase-1
LTSHGFDLDRDSTRSPAKDWIGLSAPLKVAEKLLNTTFSVWKHTSGDTIVRSTHYSLPTHLHQHIDVVQPTTNFGLFKPQRATSFFDEEAPSLVDIGEQVLASTNTTVNASCNSTITPQCLYQLYDINYNGSVATGNSISTANYLGQYVNTTDLNTFYRTYVPAAVGNPINVVQINGGINNQSVPGGEASLDSQYAFVCLFCFRPQAFV